MLEASEVVVGLFTPGAWELGHTFIWTFPAFPASGLLAGQVAPFFRAFSPGTVSDVAVSPNFG